MDTAVLILMIVCILGGISIGMGGLALVLSYNKPKKIGYWKSKKLKG